MWYRYAKLAVEEAEHCMYKKRKLELLSIAQNCVSGHSISPGRFDQYMYPYYEADIKIGKITREFAGELMDCIWVKLNDLNKARDASSAEGFVGYSLFQNLIAGGQDEFGNDVTNDLSFMCIEASMHVMLPAPSLSVRVWNKTPVVF